MDARELIAANRYMALATADAAGRPWISPVWFAPDDGGFLWISRPDSRHSRNLAERPELALVIYDSTVRPAERQALYVRRWPSSWTGSAAMRLSPASPSTPSPTTSSR
jgi:nitroimidazol reductase NimA-like FMN-containing flavoprotein (pyridoxamine 5'-phosphate oxidase superfamily)